MAVALRSILLNLMQVRGELEDGELLDENVFANSEKALLGVGIAVKELRDGVLELRNPMQILDDLANKWDSLGTIAQSVLLESIGNKRHSSALAALLEGWQQVYDVQDQFFNHNNSAYIYRSFSCEPTQGCVA
jgi:hypothetical protein